MGSRGDLHVLTVSFLGQGHVNPLLRLAKRLASMGLLVTFSTTHQIGQMIQNATNSTTTTTTMADGHFRFEFFSDGWSDDEPKRYDLDTLLSQLETVGRDSLTQLINKQAEEGRPVSCIINNPFLPWVSDLANDLGIPCAVLWVQSCVSYSAYYHYFHHLASFPTLDQQDLSVDLPGLPTLKSDEIPTLLHPSNPYLSIKNAVLKQIENLSKSLCVLVDSFEELEREAIEPMSHLSSIKLRPVGPLFIKNADTSIRGDMWSAAEDCLVWLDSQPVDSVVYVSLGSIVVLEKGQMEEMAWGLLNSGSPFLWIIKPPPQESQTALLPEDFLKEAEGKGMVVPWCQQDQVLAHPSVACFLTHCGWNSSMESLTSGVPVIAFPQWGDQVTNAKFLVDIYGIGVRMGRGIEDGKSLTREVVERCVVEVTRGPKAEEMKKKALKWKKGAEAAVADGGSSDHNLQEFVDDIRMAIKSRDGVA